MDQVWITTGSTKIAPVVNPMVAACESGYVPSDIFLLENPQIADVTQSVTSLMKTVVTAYDGAEPSITVEHLEDELDFAAIISFIRSTIERATESDAAVAVDITPGRKTWSSISFRAGFEYDVDHIFYVHLPGTYFGELYPTIPRTAIELVDFTEVV